MPWRLRRFVPEALNMAEPDRYDPVSMCTWLQAGSRTSGMDKDVTPLLQLWQHPGAATGPGCQKTSRTSQACVPTPSERLSMSFQVFGVHDSSPQDWSVARCCGETSRKNAYTAWPAVRPCIVGNSAARESDDIGRWQPDDVSCPCRWPTCVPSFLAGFAHTLGRLLGKLDCAGGHVAVHLLSGQYFLPKDQSLLRGGFLFRVHYSNSQSALQAGTPLPLLMHVQMLLRFRECGRSR